MIFWFAVPDRLAKPRYSNTVGNVLRRPGSAEPKTVMHPRGSKRRRPSRRTILIAGALLIVVLIPSIYFLIYVPRELGKQFVSVSFRPFFTGWRTIGEVEVVYNGKLIKTDALGVSINVTNSYLVPVDVKYNGYDVVLLIYNQTVTDPFDVINNTNALFWGGFYSAGYTTGWWRAHRFTRDDFAHYASHRELTNFTETIRTSAHWTNNLLFSSPTGIPWAFYYWYNESSYVSPGSYYMYCSIFGIESTPQTFTITSVPW